MDQNIIRDQIAAGRRLAASEDGGRKAPHRLGKAKAPKSSKPSGHEAYLDGLQKSGAEVQIYTLAGDKFKGRLKHADKFTLSIDIEGTTQVFFKHAIESFSPITPPPFLEAKAEIKPGLTD